MYAFEAQRRERVTTLWDHGWADATTFRVTGLGPGYEPQPLFAALIADRVFRDSFVTAASWRNATEDEHGPFAISRLRPEHFKPLSGERLLAEQERVLHNGIEPASEQAAVGAAQRAALRCFVAAQLGHDLFRLDVELGDASLRHEQARILLAFREFIFVDAAAGELIQLVLGCD